MVQMCGWFSWERARASRRNRSRADLAVERVRVEELQSHFAVECRIVRAIDDTHPAGPDGVDDAVAAEVSRRSYRNYLRLSLTIPGPIPDPSGQNDIRNITCVSRMKRDGTRIWAKIVLLNAADRATNLHSVRTSTFQP